MHATKRAAQRRSNDCDGDVSGGEGGGGCGKGDGSNTDRAAARPWGRDTVVQAATVVWRTSQSPRDRVPRCGLHAPAASVSRLASILGRLACDYPLPRS